MYSTSVTSKGRVTIPKEIRQLLGIRQGSRIEFELVDQHVELRVIAGKTEIFKSGFGMLKSTRPSLPVDFDLVSR